MKRIGIVTLIGNNNYGNRLQNYALQEKLKKFKYSPVTIRNVYGLNNKSKKIQYLKRIIKYIYKEARFYILYCNYKRLNKFKNFDKNIIMTKRIKTIYSINDKYDYYIVGSDQVWKPTYGRLSDLDLLTFTSKEKRISYAASFGVSSLKEEYHEKARNELLKFKAISVREEAGKKIIEDLTGRKDVKVLVDPTMLLTSEEWDKVSKRPKQLNNIKEEKYILNYFLGNLSEERKEEIERIAKENNCHIINILDKNDPFYETGPSEFLYLEKNAFLICTDSFHSSVFAILYNTPFIVFDREDNKENMSSRIDTLLSKFNLEDRRYNGKITKELLKCDYKEAYKILENERKKSNEFLKNALDIK